MKPQQQDNDVKCDKCAGEVSASAAVCPSCGTPLPPAVQSVLPSRKSALTRNLVVFIGIGVGCCLAGLFLVPWIASREVANSNAATDQPTQVANLGEITAKAERGDAGAQKQLGACYARGQGVPQSYEEAAKWYRQAADRGHAGAQTALAQLYEAGRGVPHDSALAAKWYRSAAQLGDAVAQYNLAVLYLMGDGVPQDNAEALKWYLQAAAQGSALAQYNLGMRYYRGQAVAQDPVEAYKWLSLAEAQGIPDAAQAIGEIKRTMTRAQITEGRHRASAFVATKPAQSMP